MHMEARMYAYVFAVIFLLPLSSNFPFKGQHLQLTGKYKADKFYVLKQHECEVGLTELYHTS